MTYSKIDIYRISILAMICFVVCFTKVDQATANLRPWKIPCWVCEEKLDPSTTKVCPRCGAPVKQGITRVTRGSVVIKDIHNFVVNFMEVYLRENGMQMAIKMLVDRLEYAEVKGM